MTQGLGGGWGAVSGHRVPSALEAQRPPVPGASCSPRTRWQGLRQRVTGVPACCWAFTLRVCCLSFLAREPVLIVKPGVCD